MFFLNIVLLLFLSRKIGHAFKNMLVTCMFRNMHVYMHVKHACKNMHVRIYGLLFAMKVNVIDKHSYRKHNSLQLIYTLKYEKNKKKILQS